MAYIDTPRTDAGNATYLDNGQNIGALSAENSFFSPIKKQSDVLSRLRSQHGVTLKTPRLQRAPLLDRRNVPTAVAQTEFTPLLKSVAKRNTTRAGKENGVLQTPAFLRNGYIAKDSPALQAPDSSLLYGNDGSSVGAVEEATPLPQMASSSAQSTPMPILSKRDNNGVLADQGNIMALREQENIIDKIDKENFGLKLKIHYLEESLRKSAPDFHQAALKENTELKVDKVTMQKELSKTRKILVQAERDLENYRLSLQDLEKKEKRSSEDKVVREDREALQQRCTNQEAEIDDLLRQLAEDREKNIDIDKLKGEIEDLEAEIRQKDRELDGREDEARAKAAKDLRRIVELEEKLDNADLQKEQVFELREMIQDLKHDIEKAKEEATEAKEDCKEAQNEQQKAEDDLNELRDEMANKSFTTKGLSRQVEEKANKLEDDLTDLREKYADLQNRLDDKVREGQRLQNAMQSAHDDAEVREQRLENANELLRNEREIALRKEDSSGTNIQNLLKQLAVKTEESDLLQTRYDALTNESQVLQLELAKAYSQAQDVQQALKQEKEFALKNDLALRNEAKERADKLSAKIDDLERRLEDEQSRAATDLEHWDNQRKDLESQKGLAEQRASGLQRTVNKLQESEGTLSGREMKLQEALESEKLRHEGEEVLLSRHVQDLRSTLEEKRSAIEGTRSELLKLKDELRISKRNEEVSEEKIQSLEDEVDILQIALDEETDRAKEETATNRQEAESLRVQLHSVKQNLNRSEASLADARAEIESFQGDLEAGHGATEQMSSRLRNLEAQLKQLREEKTELQDQFVKSETELRSLQALQLDADAVNNDVGVLRQELAKSREMETDCLHREAIHKETIHELKREISDLERQVHESEVLKLAARSPKSSVGASAQNTELVELRHQLADSHQQERNLRSKLRETERESQYKASMSEKDLKQQTDRLEEQNNQLEQQLVDLQASKREYQNQIDTAERTIARLQNRTQRLEKELKAVRTNQTDDRTIAEERKDLHELLKDAKLEAEDLQVQVADREAHIEAASVRETDLRFQLKRVRQERTLQIQKSGALSIELDSLKFRLEQTADEMTLQRQEWEEERKALVSRVRFPNMSVSSIHAGGAALQSKELEAELQKKDKRHQGELRGLAKQIHWLRAKCKREEGFRSGLAYEKRFLLMQIEMFKACNTVDLHMLEEMGVTPDKKTREKRPSFRAVGFMVVAGIRMKRLQAEWAVQKKIQASLVKKAEQMRKGSKRASGR